MVTVLSTICQPCHLLYSTSIYILFIVQLDIQWSQIPLKNVESNCFIYSLGQNHLLYLNAETQLLVNPAYAEMQILFECS